MALVLVYWVLSMPPWGDDWIFIGRAQNLSEGWQTALERILHWSPRPASEFTIFTMVPVAIQSGVPPIRLTQPLIASAYLEMIAIGAWPLALRFIRRTSYSYSLWAALLAWLTWLLTLHCSSNELLAWGAGSAAYLPAMGALVSAGCLLLQPMSRNKRDNASVIATLQLFIGALFWEGLITTFIALPLIVRRTRRWILVYCGSIFLWLMASMPALTHRWHTAEVSNSGISGDLSLLFKGIVNAANSSLEINGLLSALVLCFSAMLVSVERRVSSKSRSATSLFKAGLAAFATAMFLSIGLTQKYGSLDFQLRYVLVVSSLLCVSICMFTASFLGMAYQPAEVRKSIKLSVAVAWSLCCLIALGFSPQSSLLMDYARKGLLPEPPTYVATSINKHGIIYFNSQSSIGDGLSHELPIGTWTSESIDTEVKEEAFGSKFKFKVLKGIIKSYKLEKISVYQAGKDI